MTAAKATGRGLGAYLFENEVRPGMSDFMPARTCAEPSRFNPKQSCSNENGGQLGRRFYLKFCFRTNANYDSLSRRSVLDDPRYRLLFFDPCHQTLSKIDCAINDNRALLIERHHVVAVIEYGRLDHAAEL